MNTSSNPPTALPFRCFASMRSLVIYFLLMSAIAVPRDAMGAETGEIEGRILNSTTGDSLEKARISVEGTTIEAFSDQGGYFRISDLPAGKARVKVFYTGLTPEFREIEVQPGRASQLNVNLVSIAARGMKMHDSDTVELAKLVVSTSREMSGAAIAINEQRFAPNVTNVVAADEFGYVAEGNVAEFLKYLPGVAVDFIGGNALEISLHGVPSANVPVTVAGFNLAAAEGTGTSRSVQAGFASTNNLSRIEVSFTPTPESQGAALAGTVNLVPRSAFERSKPAFGGSVYMSMRDNARDFHKTPGPLDKPTRKVHPGFDFSLIYPVNKHFGFTLSGGRSTQYVEGSLLSNTWRGTTVGTNGTTFPNTTPDQPYLSTLLVSDRPKNQEQASFGATMDFRLSSRDQISFSFQYSSYEETNILRSVTFNVNRVLPGNFSSTFTRGAVGAGDLVLARSGRNRTNQNYTPTLVWRHNGPIWRAEAGIGSSRAVSRNRDLENGFLNTTQARRTGVTVAFEDYTTMRPRVISVTDGTTGTPVDPYSLSSYALTTMTTTNPRNVQDLQTGAYASIGRSFNWRVPFSLKAGIDLRKTERNNLGSTTTATFVGADGRGSTTPLGGSDDLAVPFLDASFSQRTAPYGFPRIQWISNELLWKDYNANPSHFVIDRNAEYRSIVSTSKYATELISSAYLRGDLSLMNRRLRMVGGLRAEQTNVEALGPLSDPTLNYQRNSDGSVILGSNGKPLLKVPTTDALGVSKLTYIERGMKAEKEYLRLFPSINVSYNVLDNLIARAGYYHSVGRPDFNQYAGGVTLPDTTAAPSTSNRITVNNAGIKAWSAQSMNVRLEYYFQGVGQISLGAFRRSFNNLFAGTLFRPTPEFLALYGLDEATYGQYDVSTQYNVDGKVYIQGLDFSYKQSLTFLPSWARGLQVFLNASAQRTTGANLGSFTGVNSLPRSASWGVSLTRQKFNVQVNWSYRTRQRRAPVAAAPSIEPGMYNWIGERLFVDVMGEYHLWKRISAFANFRNLLGVPENLEIAGPSTPDHARFRSRQEYGVLWTFGLRGRF
ncbi:MAG: carboxypeptidase regulatory-like domain-containing protein [Opitutaceae bacterium]|nr:carboxypeptidase regulatory-like domain-containing protein [Opitutaceae bacterium]